jgi:acyl transferase domain-containing protein/acyl carrier protein
MSPVKRALLALETMQAKLDAIEAAKHEPIAIIGMGCRFPRADNLDAFWRLLRDGEDAISDVPADRWDATAHYDPNPDAPGKMYTCQGGFLSQVDRFDPQFFGISTREALSLDPQQRLLLEVSWEALEHANQPIDRLFNSATGVFIGICANDYNRLIWNHDDFSAIDAFSATGNALSVAAGRLSYTLGLKGTSLAVDTACSSSLVTVHLACQQLRTGECEVALAGGVNLLLAPDSTIAFSRTRMLNPEGRCNTFDAAANGYVRGEGCGMVILKRLSDAVVAGDRILAVIRGSAVNHNGRSSSLIAPNGLSQQTVIRKALEDGGVDPAQVDYVEVQGTGTSIGEPIEVEALGAVYGKRRSSDRPLQIGSVKTNIGHLEAASGIASLIKVVLALQHGEIPAHLHFQTPNPHINWELPIQVAADRSPWPIGHQPRLAGVSAFGFSGTNAHLVIEEAPIAPAEPIRWERPLHLLALSAKSEAALTQLVEQYEKHLIAHPDESVADVCFTANCGRSHFPHRLSLIAASSTELCEKLSALNRGDLELHPKATTPPKIAFLFSGEGTIANLGRSLYETQPLFRQTIDRCSEILKLDQSLLEIPDSNADYSPPARFAVEYALFQLWTAWGVRPAIVLGGGVGEVVAVCAAGMLSLEDALQFVSRDADTEPKLPSVAPQIAIVSSRTGKLVTDAIALSNWQSNPDSLSAGLQTLHDQGCTVFLELGSAALSQTGAQLLPDAGHWLASLHPDRPDWEQMLDSLGVLYKLGTKINWFAFDQDYARQFVSLPTYPWQRDRYWMDALDRSSPTPQKLDPAKLMQQLQASGKCSKEELAMLPKVLTLLAEIDSPITESPEPIEPATLRQLHPKVLTASEIQDWLLQEIAKAIGIKSEDLNPRLPFDSYGLDSILALSVIGAAQTSIGLELSPLLLVHYPTVESLSQHLAKTLEASEEEIFEI